MRHSHVYVCIYAHDTYICTYTYLNIWPHIMKSNQKNHAYECLHVVLCAGFEFGVGMFVSVVEAGSQAELRGLRVSIFFFSFKFCFYNTDGISFECEISTEVLTCLSSTWPCCKITFNCMFGMKSKMWIHCCRRPVCHIWATLKRAKQSLVHLGNFAWLLFWKLTFLSLGLWNICILERGWKLLTFYSLFASFSF